MSNKNSIDELTDVAFLKLNIDKKSKNSIHPFKQRSRSSEQFQNIFVNPYAQKRLRRFQNSNLEEIDLPSEKKRCPICSSPFPNPDEQSASIIELPCKHEFCELCLSKYISSTLNLFKVII
jgi:hypothetical protein